MIHGVNSKGGVNYICLAAQPCPWSRSLSAPRPPEENEPAVTASVPPLHVPASLLVIAICTGASEILGETSVALASAVRLCAPPRCRNNNHNACACVCVSSTCTCLCRCACVNCVCMCVCTCVFGSSLIRALTSVTSSNPTTIKSNRITPLITLFRKQSVTNDFSYKKDKVRVENVTSIATVVPLHYPITKKKVVSLQ